MTLMQHLAVRALPCGLGHQLQAAGAIHLLWVFYPRSHKSREAQGGLEHGFLPAGALDRKLLSTPVCQSLRPETGAGLCMVGSAHPHFHAWGQIPLLIKTKGWEGAGGFTSDEILFLGLFWYDEWKKENMVILFSTNMTCLECNVSHSPAETFFHDMIAEDVCPSLS